MRNYFLTNRFFIVLFSIVILFAVSFKIPILLLFSQIILLVFVSVTVIDLAILSFPKKPFKIERILPEKLSNGDYNPITLEIKCYYNFAVNTTILEDLPFQFQAIDFEHNHRFGKEKEVQIIYEVKPEERGEYSFGNIYALAESFIGFVHKRSVIQKQQKIACYPSFMQLKKYEFLAIGNYLTDYGLKKIRRLEQNTEFAQIRDYIPGDEYRNINWKASARKGSFMVNQYQDERSQNIYCLIDKGRAMKMPFNGLTLLD